MNKKIIILIIIVLSSMLFISGCAQIQNAVSSNEVNKIATVTKTNIQNTADTLIRTGKNFIGAK